MVYFFLYQIYCSEPRLPHINHQDKLKEIFPADPNEVSWLFADHTFPLFCALLEYHEYSDHVILGLSASIGQLTESLVTTLGIQNTMHL